MRIFFININGLYSSTTKLQDVFVTARGINAEIIGMAETNTDWKKHHLQNRYTTALRQLSNNYKQFEAWNNFKMQLYKIFQVLRKKHTYKPILQALHHNIIRYYNDEELEPPTPIEHPKEYDITLQEAFKEQTTIGWNHILKGWVSHKWAQAQDEYYRNRAKQDERINRKYDNGIAWNKLLITELQAAAFTTWKFRNKDIYGHSKEEEEAIHLQKLKTTVRREYERRLTYPTRIQWRYFTRTVSDRVNDTAQMLQAWYINLKTAIAANEERPIVAIGTG